MPDSPLTGVEAASSGGNSWAALLFRTTLMLVLIGLAVVGLYQLQSVYQVALIITLVGYFPLSYLSYLQFRVGMHKERVKDDFRLLGLVQGASGAAELDVLYRQIYSQQQFVIYVSLATLTTLLGFGLFHLRADLSFISESVATTTFYTFLGAYVFSIHYVYRRYSTLDLQPAVYLYITRRMIGVQAVAFVAAGQLQTSAGGVQALVAAMAFIIGYFPDTGIRWLTSLAERSLGQSLARNENRLSNIDGISLWHEARLRESGIDNVQNLATVDVRELLLGSRFSAQQLMHWIDQALLIINLPQEKYTQLYQYGIHTISAFRALWDQVESQQLTEIKQILPPAIQALYYATAAEPNLHYVTQYWQAVKEYRTQIVTGSLQQLLGEQAEQFARARSADFGVIERLSQVMVNLEVAPQDLESLFPDTPESLVALGGIYFQRQLYSDAIRVLTQAIAIDGQNTAAYCNRGLAYAGQGNYPRAFEDFEQAEQLDPGYATTFNHKGAVYIQQGKYQEAITTLNRALELDSTDALAYYYRGQARRSLGQLDQAIQDFGQALGYNADLYLAHYERGLTYLGLGDYVNAIYDLDSAIRGNRTYALAYSSRGAAYMELGDYRRAIYDLDTAVELDPGLAKTYSNRGQARLQLGDVEGAIDDFDQALRLDSQLAQTYKNRALANAENGALPEAVADFKRYLRLWPDAPDADDVQRWIEQLQQRISPPTPPAPG
jgi:tetratricopeptide (TPR) repeat protein